MLDKDDHRQLGHQLDLFHFQEEAPGMVFWHPRGFALYRVIEEVIRRRMQASGALEVRTPQVMRSPIWEASGHWQSFRDGMMQLDGDVAAALKPVSCPGHLEIVRRMLPSYRDLPLCIGELGLVHRNEPSGTLHGLFRLRQFTQDDGHIFCSEEHVASEVERFIAAQRALYAAFGFEEVSVGFSTRPPVRAGSDAVWDRAEDLLFRAARASGLAPVEQPGEGAFYGPKLEMALGDRHGRAWQCGTIQLDFVLAGRFDVSYTSPSGARLHPALLHRALLGSLERFIGIVLEHHRGRLPAWLAPDQVAVLPVSPAHREYAERAAERLRREGLRVVLDARDESLSRRVAAAHALAVPYAAVAGDREVEAVSLALREPGAGARVLPLEEAAVELARAGRPPI